MKEIIEQTRVLTDACFKVAKIIKATDEFSGHAKAELVRHASDLSILSRGLVFGQSGELLAKRLFEVSNASSGCAFWLQYTLDQNLMESSIIQPLIGECDRLLLNFMQAGKNVQNKLD
jgi:hypothetical protein